MMLFDLNGNPIASTERLARRARWKLIAQNPTQAGAAARFFLTDRLFVRDFLLDERKRATPLPWILSAARDCMAVEILEIAALQKGQLEDALATYLYMLKEGIEAQLQDQKAEARS